MSFRGPLRVLKGIFGSNENLSNGEKRKGKAAQATGGNLQKALILNRSNSMPVVGLKKNDDKYGMRLKEIPENIGESLTNEESEENGIGGLAEESKENVKPHLANCNPVMGMRAKQEFVKSCLPGRSQRVDDRVCGVAEGISRTRSISHLQFQSPTPYYKKPSVDFQSEISNFQVKRESTLIPELGMKAYVKSYKTEEFGANEGEVKHENQKTNCLGEPPIPKPRTSLKSREELSVRPPQPKPRTPFKQTLELSVTPPRHKPRKLKPFEWQKRANHQSNGSVSMNTIVGMNGNLSKQNKDTSCQENKRKSSDASSEDNEMGSFVIVNSCSSDSIATPV